MAPHDSTPHRDVSSAPARGVEVDLRVHRQPLPEDLRDETGRLVALARRGLPRMLVDGGFVHTVRAVSSDSSSSLQPEGSNLRYSAIVALGCAFTNDPEQRQILHGATAAEFTRTLIQKAAGSHETGGLALTAWAAAEAAGIYAADLFQPLQELLAGGAPIATVECAWILSAATAAKHLGDTSELSRMAATRLMAAQGSGGLFPHMLPSRAGGWFRMHLGCFADQVYPIQALARHFAVSGDDEALAAANACAARICALQGAAGQWWWHYDARAGAVVEGYPVYSVHQHAMGPMALLDLWEAGGDDHRDAVADGLRWLKTRPEVSGDLISDEHNVIWRKVGRREPRKAVRSICAVTTSLRPGLRLPGLDFIFPPGKIDYECRPYELGWLLYAWLSAGVVERLREARSAVASPEQRTGPATPESRQVLFGLRLDPLTMEGVVARCQEALKSRSPLLLGVLNAAKIVKLRSDPALLASLLECHLLLADGQSIVWASRLLGRPLPERVAGIDIFENLLALAHREGRSVYLLGARPEVLRVLEERLLTRYPGLKIAGRSDGYFSESEGERIADNIRRSGADMLFLGMSSPKKEIFLGSFKNSLDVPILHGVGGSFDILAGMTKRAPASWQRAGMEWAFRLLQEPRRMAWRYLSTNTRFLLLTIREYFSPSPLFHTAVPDRTNRDTVRRGLSGTTESLQ